MPCPSSRAASAIRLAGLALVLLSGAAQAADAGCNAGKRSIAREQDLLPKARKIAFEGTAPAGEPVTASLKATADLAYQVPPQRSPGPGTHGAILKTTIPKPGLYQVTLSDRAWIDVLQGGRAIPSSDFTEAPACPGLRKSVRFQLAAGPAVLELSGAPATAVTLILLPTS